MRVETIYKNNKKVVKTVWCRRERENIEDFVYTETCLINEEGLCYEILTVYKDGTVNIQKINKQLTRRNFYESKKCD